MYSSTTGLTAITLHHVICSTKHIGANCPELVRTVQDYPCPERKLLFTSDIPDFKVAASELGY